MDTFDEALQKAKGFFDSACKKTDEVVNVSKLKFELSSAENKLDKAYLTLGKVQYDVLKGNEDLEPQLKAIVLDVNEKLEAVETLRNEIAKLTGKGVCKECGAVLNSGAVFCSSCGKKV